MSDATLRARERAARAESLPADRARVLVDRLRTAPHCEVCEGRGRVHVVRTAEGEKVYPVDGTHAVGDARNGRPCSACAGTGSPFRARVELAAYCGSEESRDALGSPWTSDHGLGVQALSFRDWVHGLARWASVGPLPGWLGAKACHASATVVILRLIDGQPMAHACASLGAQADWLADPTDERLNAWADAWDAAADWNGSPDWLLASSHRLDFDQVRAEILCAAREVGEPAVRFAVQTALVFWALGEP